MLTVRILSSGVILAASAVGAHAQVVSATTPGYTIQGESPMLAGQKLYLLPLGNMLPAKKNEVLDSALADANGRFRLHGLVLVPSVYMLRINQQQYMNPVALDNHASLSATAKKDEGNILLNFSSSPEQALMEKSMRYFMLGFKEMPADDKPLANFKALLEENQASYLTPYLAYKYLRMQASQQAYVEALLPRLEKLHPGSPYLPMLRESMNGQEALAVGALAPDLTLTTADGAVVKLSSLRGQYVLLDFWASWCKPCRAENPNVLAAYDEFKNKGAGFTVYAVSLDDNRAKWLQAVQQDGLPWTHVSDLVGWQSPAAKTYKVTGIPNSWLVDPTGRIIAKNLRGKELSRELSKRLP
jgi:peroxiredoxin